VIQLASVVTLNISFEQAGQQHRPAQVPYHIAMARPREVLLDEVRIHSQYLDDALAAILHTILFVRAPSVVKAKDHACQSLSPLIFAKCGPKEVDRIIEYVCVPDSDKCSLLYY
jgi:hypothetical protein